MLGWKIKNAYDLIGGQFKDPSAIYFPKKQKLGNKGKNIH